jgi:hypothetical protein
VDQKLQQLSAVATRSDVASDARPSAIRVSLLAGTGGGTGSGMVIDVANLIKSLAAERNLQVEVHGYFVCNCFANSNSLPLLATNTYALLTELNHVTAVGNETGTDKPKNVQRFESPAAPFDYVYWMPVLSRKADAGQVDALDAMAKYLACQRLRDVGAAIGSCRQSKTPREEQDGRTLIIRKPGFASLAEQKRLFLSHLAAELAEAVKQHWLTKDNSADWERLVQQEQQALINLKANALAENGKGQASSAVPDQALTLTALRGRFREQMSFTLTSEVLRHIQHQLESCDDRGRPLISASDAKLIADTARAFISSLSASMQRESKRDYPIAMPPASKPLVAAGSRRILSKAIEKFDFKQPDRFLPVDEIDELVTSECQALLECSLSQPEFAAAIDAHIDLDQSLSRTLERATTDLLQCGSDRRTLLFAPTRNEQTAAIEKLQALRPQVAAIPSDVDDVIIICEESGISPRSLANGLERVLPGIADAARRLQTRVDIDWQSLY